MKVVWNCDNYCKTQYIPVNQARIKHYGNKDDAALIERVVTVCRQAVAEQPPRLLVVACNTASTLALPALRAALDIPVVGVVPALKVAAAASANGRIGLLATPARMNRP